MYVCMYVYTVYIYIHIYIYIYIYIPVLYGTIPHNTVTNWYIGYHRVHTTPPPMNGDDIESPKTWESMDKLSQSMDSPTNRYSRHTPRNDIYIDSRNVNRHQTYTTESLFVFWGPYAYNIL